MIPAFNVPVENLEVANTAFPASSVEWAYVCDLILSVESEDMSTERLLGKAFFSEKKRYKGMKGETAVLLLGGFM